VTDSNPSGRTNGGAGRVVNVGSPFHRAGLPAKSVMLSLSNVTTQASATRTEPNR